MLQLAKADNHLPSVDKFFNLQNDMNQTLLIVQSLKSISSLKENDGDPNSPGSVSEALKLALERKKNATSWVKAALLSDLNPISSSDTISFHATNTTKKPITDFNQKTKGMSLARMQRNNEMHTGWAAECNSPDWVKGSTIDAAAQLSSTLQDECKKWFLAHVEDYLDEVKSRTLFKSSDIEVAEMMRQIKKVNDWLDMMVGRKDGSIFRDSELKAYGRVRDKIYAILLQNVERSAMALEHTN
ncbi:hypothetical protein L6164_035775 [Bauhinia variegata]|nr:hypothetical protein L6164_035775 [Bauhinia variegata]